MEREVIEDMFEKFASRDKDQCGLRLVCELAQKDPNYLTGDEILILLPYRGREQSDKNGFYERYDKAVWHGQRGGPCKELFPLCPYTAPQIMGYTATNTTDITY